MDRADGGDLLLQPHTLTPSPANHSPTMQASDPLLIGAVSLDTFLVFLFTLLAFLFLGNLIYMLLRRVLDGRVSPGTAKWAAAILQYVVIIGGIYGSARHLLAFDLKAVATSLGILGIVVAASSSQVIQNILAGILITINRPVHLEEWIIVGERPTTGLCKVRDISFTTTILQGLDGGLILMPNSSIISSKVVNYSRGGLRRSRSRSRSRSRQISAGARDSAHGGAGRSPDPPKHRSGRPDQGTGTLRPPLHQTPPR